MFKRIILKKSIYDISVDKDEDLGSKVFVLKKHWKLDKTS